MGQLREESITESYVGRVVIVVSQLHVHLAWEYQVGQPHLSYGEHIAHDLALA